MTIKQQGGVFGRNPSFNDVDADQVTTNTANVADLVVSNSSSFKGNMAFKNSAGTQMAFIAPSLGGSFRLQGQSAEPMTFWINNVQVGEFNNSRDFKINNGNLVIGTSGKGIDFSATSGTGTSELFDDYEEGTWTPVLTTDGTNFTSVTYDGITSGSYTKVGNLVHVQFTLRTDAVTVGSASGSVRLGNLPFTAKTGNGGLATLSISSSASWSGEQPSAILIISGTNVGNFVYRTAADGALSNTAVADVNTGSDANLIRASGTYLV